MKRMIYFLIALLALASTASAATTAVIGTPITGDIHGELEVVLPITITSDGSGGALSAKTIPSVYFKHMNLVEVEIEHGTSTCAVTVVNSRDTETWAITAMDATKNRRYGGHITTGIFPKCDTDLKITTGVMDATDEVVVHLKFSSKP